MFGEKGILCNEDAWYKYAKIFKNGYLYIGFELDKNEMLDNGVEVSGYDFSDLHPLIEKLPFDKKSPKLFAHWERGWLLG